MLQGASLAHLGTTGVSASSVRVVSCNAVGSRHVLSVAVLERPLLTVQPEEVASTSGRSTNVVWTLPLPVTRSTRTHTRRLNRTTQSQQAKQAVELDHCGAERATSSKGSYQLDKAGEYICCRIIQVRFEAGSIFCGCMVGHASLASMVRMHAC